MSKQRVLFDKEIFKQEKGDFLTATRDFIVSIWEGSAPTVIRPEEYIDDVGYDIKCSYKVKELTFDFWANINLKKRADAVRFLSVSIANEKLDYTHYVNVSTRKLEDFHDYLEWLNEAFLNDIKHAKDDQLRWWLGNEKSIVTTGFEGITRPNEDLFEYLLRGHKTMIELPQYKFKRIIPAIILEIGSGEGISFLLHTPILHIDWMLFPVAFATGYSGTGPAGYNHVHQLIKDHRSYFPITLIKFNAPYSRDKNHPRSSVQDYIINPLKGKGDEEGTFLENLFDWLSSTNYNENSNIDFKEKIPDLPFPEKFKQEFVKDCIALANCYRGELSDAYYLIGFSAPNAKWNFKLYSIQNLERITERMTQIVNEYITPRLLLDFHQPTLDQVMKTSISVDTTKKESDFEIKDDRKGECLIIEFRRDAGVVYELAKQLGNFPVGISWYRTGADTYEMTGDMRDRLKVQRIPKIDWREKRRFIGKVPLYTGKIEDLIKDIFKKE